MRTLTDDERQAVVAEAKKWLDVPYKLKGNTRKGIDCSQLVMAVYKNALNITLITQIPPLFLASWLFYKLDVIPVHSLKKGDLVFYCSQPRPVGRIVTSVAIYIGENKVIHASLKLRKVSIENLYDYDGILVDHKDPAMISQWLQETK